MVDMTFEDVAKAAEQLSDEERAALIERLQASLAEPSGKKRPLLDFPVDDLGPWPEALTLRREDLYGDDGR